MATVNGNIDLLKDRFKDWCRPNLFTIDMRPPQGVAYTDGEYIESAVFGATLPSMTIGEIPLLRMGVKVPIPGDVQYGDFSITFGNDVEVKVRNFFYDWVKSRVNDFEKNKNAIPGNALMSDITVKQLDGKLNVVQKIRVYHCWPSSIAEIALSTDTENTIETFQVNFAYSYYRINPKD